MAQQRMVPWNGKAQKLDIALVIIPIALGVIGLVLRFLTPHLIAEYPLELSLWSGGNMTVGSAAAFASVEGRSLIPVILAGTFGSLWSAWVWWLIGKRWGVNVIQFMTPSPFMRASIMRLRHKKWLAFILIPLYKIPGLPNGIVMFMGGWMKMKLVTFYFLATIGTVSWVTFIALLTAHFGEEAVDVVLLIDQYAMYIMLAMIFMSVFYTGYREHQRQTRKSEEADDKQAQ